MKSVSASSCASDSNLARFFKGLSVRPEIESVDNGDGVSMAALVVRRFDFLCRLLFLLGFSS